MRKEIRFSGFGGQGIVLMGYIMGKALAITEGLEAVMTQSYGPEARGGASSSNIVVSDEPIAYPFVQKPEILVAMSQEAYSKFRGTAAEGATILIDEDLVSPKKSDVVHAIPATRFAEDLGRRIVANVVMLGFITSVTNIAKRASLEKAIETTVKEKTIPLNMEAFSIGYEYALQKEPAS
jgi:2-oxoglutarate ferredoxin oxidoreductase subunit gamma